ncbi:uncharacterized protein LOC111332743 isoform X2 [Stylophora pistillata]|nr:uncharacterized protein LOC111332743 isoform X2 [Stylophora pistillata]
MHHQGDSFLGNDDEFSVQQQTNYLRNLAENIHTEGAGQNMPLSMSPDQVSSILGAITQRQEFPCHSPTLDYTSGFFESSGSTDVRSSSSAPSIGNTSGSSAMTSSGPGIFGTTSQQDSPPFLYSHSTGQIISSPHFLTGEGGEVSSCGFAQRDRSRSYPRQDVSSDLFEITPFNSGSPIDIDQYLRPDVEVKFCDLEGRVFEKQQSRKDKKARQRIINGKVKFLVRSERPIEKVKAWVRREENAAKLEKDANGMVEIATDSLEKVKESGLLYLECQVDLDSVYKMDGSERPVYKLAKVHTTERNLFELVVQVVFSDSEVSEQIKSNPFLIKTKRLNDEPLEPDTHSKRTRPNTCPTSSSRWNRGKQSLQNEADSTDPRSPSSQSSTASRNSPSSSAGELKHVDDLVVNHLKAQQANIDNLTVTFLLQTRRGDIAYHLRLTNPSLYQTLDEGIVVGFFPNDDGMAQIEPLSSENATRAVMAGVISRSAYVEAHAPSEKEIGETDIVCVIGMVKVLIIGSVKTGERIYASTDSPGTGIAESHLPLGALIFRDHTLLGMAMEPCTPRYHDEVNLVKCFVCIVLGINSHQLSNEVENIMENVDMDIKAAIGKSNKRNCRRLFFLIAGFITFLGLLGFLLYEVLTPGTRFRYFLCQAGSNREQPNLKCNYQDAYVNISDVYIPFDLDNLIKKIPYGERKPEIISPKNATSPIYFLNFDRCAYGGRTDSSMYTPEPAKPVCGPPYLASSGNCSKVFTFSWGEWKVMEKTKQKDVNYMINCVCNGSGMVLCQWIVFLLLSFSVYYLFVNF